jgi:hypothetical protein
MTALLIIGLFTHWFADFWLQTNWQATNKSINNDALIEHTSNYSMVWAGVIFLVAWNSGFTLIGSFIIGMLFSAITFAAHTTTDYYTSRKVSKLFAKQDYHNAFVVIGFDQILHYLQLYFTYKLFFS